MSSVFHAQTGCELRVDSYSFLTPCLRVGRTALQVMPAGTNKKSREKDIRGFLKQKIKAAD
jgi:hypothetical protein